MEDAAIVALYWDRDEEAIRETQRKYEHYLMTIAQHILADWEDSRESVNDTYLGAWRSMPPQRPQILSTYLGKITRQLSIDRYRSRHREKRQGSAYTVSLSELEDCVSGGGDTGQGVELEQLAQAIGRYLRTRSPRCRGVFVGRYYFMDSLEAIAGHYGMSPSGVKSLLFRTRQGLKRYLEQEGLLP